MLQPFDNVWIFGSSVCLPFNLENPFDGWPNIIEQQLNTKCINLAQPAADNFFIYHCFKENLNKIKNTDLVIIGWSHYSRKSFVLDRSNPDQMSVIERSIIYKTNEHEFIRGINPPSGINTWLTMRPVDRGLRYYDTWFKNYYSEYEQKCHFQSYLDSVKLNCVSPCLNFYFSKESIQGIDTTKLINVGFITEFIKENNVAISSTDAHLNQLGHELWANYLIKSIDYHI